MGEKIVKHEWKIRCSLDPNNTFYLLFGFGLTVGYDLYYTMYIMKKKGESMYKVIIGDIVYLYDNMKDARKAFHIAVTKNGINNVQVMYV